MEPEKTDPKMDSFIGIRPSLHPDRDQAYEYLERLWGAIKNTYDYHSITLPWHMALTFTAIRFLAFSPLIIASFSLSIIYSTLTMFPRFNLAIVVLILTYKAILMLLI